LFTWARCSGTAFMHFSSRNHSSGKELDQSPHLDEHLEYPEGDVALRHARDRIVGVDQIIAEAVGMKFLAAPLTPQQVKELIQIPQ
jgi:hypothetical protein